MLLKWHLDFNWSGLNWLFREAFGFICRDQATTGFLGYIFKFAITLSFYKENPMTRLFPVSSQVLKLWSGGGYHDVPQSLLHGGPRGDEERVSCAWSCGAMRGLPHGLLANLGIFYLFVSHRFGLTACVLIWKVWCQPKLKAYCSRRLRALSRWWTKRLDQLKQADIRMSGRVYLPRCKEQKHQTLMSKIR